MNYDEAMKHCIFRFCSGSRAYGTNTEDSDYDYRGVFIAPINHAFDIFNTSFVGEGTILNHLKETEKAIEQRDWHVAKERIRLAQQTNHTDLNLSIGTIKKPNEDEELQELRKFLKLASECNPNIIEFLFVDRLITHETKIFEKIRENRDLFINKRARHTFSGYAYAQLKRIKSHRKYLLNPPDHQPTRSEFGLPENTTISIDYHNAITSIPVECLNEGIRDTVNKERIYSDAMSDWVAYKRWEKERNQKRREMEKLYGFDVKHASHLVRLLRMSVEILRDKTVKVFREDKDELIAIKNGEWSFDQVLEFAEKTDLELDVLYKQSDLKSRPDLNGIANLYRTICEDYYGIDLKGNIK